MKQRRIGDERQALFDVACSVQERAIDLAARDHFPARMRRLGGNVTKAAIEAGMEREALHRLLRRYNLDAGRFRV